MNALRFLGKFCAILLLYAVPQTAQSAPISYNFLITSLFFESTGLPVPGFTPHIGGNLFLDASAVARGSVFYSAINLEPLFGNPHPPFVIVGDTDFSFNITDTGNAIFAPVPDNPDTNPTILDVLVNLTVTNRGLLSGTIDFNSIFENFSISIVNNIATGRVATDDDTFGCPFSQCTFTAVIPTPEPSSQAVLIAALGILAAGYGVRRLL